MNDKKKLEQIDILSNCIQSINNKEQKNEIAYLIHRIIDTKELTRDLYNEIACYKIKANSNIFMKV